MDTKINFADMYYFDVSTDDLARAIEVIRRVTPNSEQYPIRFPNLENMSSKAFVSIIGGNSSCLAWYSMRFGKKVKTDRVTPLDDWQTAMTMTDITTDLVASGRESVTRIIVNPMKVKLVNGKQSLTLDAQSKPRPPHTIVYRKDKWPSSRTSQDMTVSRTELLHVIRWMETKVYGPGPVAWVFGTDSSVVIDTSMPSVDMFGSPTGFSKNARAITGTFVGDQNIFCVSLETLGTIVRSLHSNQIRLRIEDLSVEKGMDQLVVIGDDGACEIMMPVPTWVTGMVNPNGFRSRIWTQKK